MNQTVDEQRKNLAESSQLGRQLIPTLSQAGSRWALIAIVSIYLVMAVGFSQVMHFSRALDEGRGSGVQNDERFRKSVRNCSNSWG